MDHPATPPDDADRSPPVRTAVARKPWRAPQFMLSQVPDTQFSASPIATDGTPVSQAS